MTEEKLKRANELKSIIANHNNAFCWLEKRVITPLAKITIQDDEECQMSFKVTEGMNLRTLLQQVIEATLIEEEKEFEEL